MNHAIWDHIGYCALLLLQLIYAIFLNSFISLNALPLRIEHVQLKCVLFAITIDPLCCADFIGNCFSCWSPLVLLQSFHTLNVNTNCNWNCVFFSSLYCFQMHRYPIIFPFAVAVEIRQTRQKCWCNKYCVHLIFIFIVWKWKQLDRYFCNYFFFMKSTKFCLLLQQEKYKFPGMLCLLV